MRFSVSREALLKPLQLTAGVVDKKQTLPVLGNVLLSVENEALAVTSTDMELEIVARSHVTEGEDGAITVPARKLLDICRMLPEGSEISLSMDKGRATVRSGKSRFLLSTLPAADFPNMEGTVGLVAFDVPQRVLKRLIEQTQFAMAQQDVRYYLNGMLLEVGEDVVRCVATDGHRLALSEAEVDTRVQENYQVILPRKAVQELGRLLADDESVVKVDLGANHMSVRTADVTLSTKLVDGRFPDYQRVVPQGGDKIVISDRESLRAALGRISILSNERYRSVRFAFHPGVVKVSANNPEQEEAEEEISVDYNGGYLEIGFNATYVQEALAALKDTDVRLTLSDANSCCLIKAVNDESTKYVVMPMRL
jgi:DNA polymerase-3 subunit beta